MFVADKNLKTLSDYSELVKHGKNGSTILSFNNIKFLLKIHKMKLIWPRDFQLIYKATVDGDSADDF